MVSRLSLIKSVPWFTNAAATARFSATRSIWSKCLTSVSVYLTLLPSEVTSAFPVPSMETPAVKLLKASTLPLPVPIPKSLPESLLLIMVILSPALSSAPPAKLRLLRLMFVLASALSVVLSVIFKTVPSLYQVMLLKSISLKFYAPCIFFPVQPLIINLLLLTQLAFVLFKPPINSACDKSAPSFKVILLPLTSTFLFLIS